MSNEILVNCCPHALHIRMVDGTMFTVEPSGDVARCEENRIGVGQTLVFGSGARQVGISSVTYGPVTGLPEPREGRKYLVSLLTAQAVKARYARDDVYALGPAIRDAEGRIVGCDGLTLV
jgi:hypothetical protein